MMCIAKISIKKKKVEKTVDKIIFQKSRKTQTKMVGNKKRREKERKKRKQRHE